MDLVQIRYFLALSRLLNFTRAAEACNVTQPALTKAIQRLEDELGGPLLLRERALTQLTHLGRTILPLLQQTYDAAQSAKEHARSLKRAASSPLRIGFTPGTPTPPFIPVLTELAAKLDGFELVLEDADGPGLCAALLHGTLDVAILPRDPAVPERLNVWPLFKDEVVLLLPPNHPLTDEPDPVSLGDVPVIAARTGPLPGPMPGRHVVQSPGRMADLVRAGFGAGTATARGVPHGLAHRALPGLPPVEFCVAAVAGRPYSRAADAFVKLVRARAWA